MKTATARLGKAEIEQAMISPTAVFDSPAEVVAAASLTAEQKVEILKRWELDARALQRATEENMSGGEPPLLDEVNAALTALDPKMRTLEQFGKAPTKL